jgi:site-specific DNA-cytosine methylase
MPTWSAQQTPNGAVAEGIRQIGNCVPPLFMRAVAAHIRATILTATVDSQPAA